LISFSGKAFVYSPFTMDYSALKLFVNDMTVGMVSKPGTSIESAFNTAFKTFEKGPGRSKILLLYTDGESFDGSVKTTLRKLANKGVTIMAVGVGTTDGEPIPIKDAQNEIVRYKRDKNQAIVISKLRPLLLNQVASETGGQYFVSNSDNLATVEVYKALSLKEKREMEAQMQHRFIDRYYLFLGAALLFLLLDLMIPERLLRKKRSIVFLTLTISLTLICPANAIGNKAHSLNELGIKALKGNDPEAAITYFGQGLSEDPSSGKLMYNLGNAFYRSGVFDKAAQAYGQAIARLNKDLKAAAHFNLGNTFLKQNAPQQAIDQYKITLRNTPNNLAAKHNLELALKQLAEPSSPELSKDETDKTDPSETPTEQTPINGKTHQEITDVQAFLESLDDAEQLARKRYMKAKAVPDQEGENDW